MASNFQVGDRVVVLSVSNSGADRALVGKAFTVERVSVGGSVGDYAEVGDGWGVYFKDLEHEDIYDSPLWRALR